MTRRRWGPDSDLRVSDLWEETVRIGVDGPEDEGRTLLVERLLASNRARTLTVARFEEAPELEEVRRVEPGDEVLERYREAGAWRVALFRYPPEAVWEAVESFGRDIPLHVAADAVLVEGPVRDRVYPVLAVHVLRPLPEGEALLRKEPKEMLRLPFEEYVRHTMGRPPGPGSGEDPEVQGEEGGEEGGEGKETESAVVGSLELSVQEEARLLDLLEHGVPIYQHRWTLPGRHRGLADASLVVVHAEDEEERERAEALAAEIPRVWDDDEVRRHLGARRVSRHGERVRVANLADPSDPGTRKVLARIKRKVDRG